MPEGFSFTTKTNAALDESVKKKKRVRVKRKPPERRASLVSENTPTVSHAYDVPIPKPLRPTVRAKGRENRMQHIQAEIAAARKAMDDLDFEHAKHLPGAHAPSLPGLPALGKATAFFLKPAVEAAMGGAYSAGKKKRGFVRPGQGLSPQLSGLAAGHRSFLEDLQLSPDTLKYLTHQKASPGLAAMGAIGFIPMGEGNVVAEQAAVKLAPHLDEVIAQALKNTRFRKVFDERQGKWVESKIPGYTTKVGHAAEKATESLRKAIGEHKLSPMKSGSQKIAQEERRASTMTFGPLRTRRAKVIGELGRKLEPPEQYALRSIAHNRSPQEEAAYARKQAKILADAGDEAGAQNQLIHAAIFDQVDKLGLVEVDESGNLRLAHDRVSKTLKRIDRLWGEQADMREAGLMQMGILDAETILRRIDAPAAEIDKALSGLRESIDRNRIYEGLKAVDPKMADNWIEIFDARSLAMAEQAKREADEAYKEQRWLKENGQPHNEQLLDKAAYYRRFGVPNDIWYSRLRALNDDFTDSDIQHIHQAWQVETDLAKFKEKRQGRDPSKAKVRFHTQTGQRLSPDEAEFWDAPYNQRMPFLMNRETGDVYFGNPGDSHADIGPRYFGDNWTSLTTQGDIRVEDGTIVAIHGMPGLDKGPLEALAQQHLDDFVERHFGRRTYYNENGPAGSERLPSLSFRFEGPPLSTVEAKAPKNLKAKLNPKRRVFEHKNPTIRRQGMTVAGPVTTRAWLTRVKKVMPSKKERQYWAQWYEHFEPAFREAFGDDADAIMRGFALSQANTSPAGGLGAVLKVMDRLRNGQEITSEGIGMIAHAIHKAVQNTPLEKGAAAKLSDFMDALALSPTRGWMGHEAAGGAPAPADIWAARDLGWVDSKFAKKLKEVFGIDAVVDSTGAPSGARYEQLSEQYAQIAEHLNKIEFDGRKDWKPAQAQALGWASAQKMVGTDPEDLAFALQRNTRTIDFEMTQGPLGLGNDLNPDEAAQVVEEMTPEIQRLVESIPGLYLRDVRSGVSGWAGGINTSVHVGVVGSEDTVHDALTAFAQAFDQELVQASRQITRAGAKAALVVSSPAFADESVKVAFFNRLAELVPEISKHGFMPDTLMDDPALTVVTARGYTGPSTSDKFLSRYEAGIAQAEGELGIQVRYGTKNVELKIGGQHGREGFDTGAGTVGGRRVDDPLAAEIRGKLEAAIARVREGRSPERAGEADRAVAREQYDRHIEDVARTMGAKGKEVTDVQRAAAEADTLKYAERGWPDEETARQFLDLRERAGVGGVEGSPDPELLFRGDDLVRRAAGDTGPLTKYIHGLHVSSGGKAHVSISKKSQQKNLTLAHEIIGHYNQLLDDMPADFRAALKQHGYLPENWQGMSDAEVSDFHEKFAKLAEAYVFHGGKELPPRLREAFGALSTKVRREIKSELWGGQRPKPKKSAAEAELFAFFDQMHSWEDALRMGQRYAPETRGPAQPLKGMFARFRKSEGASRAYWSGKSPMTVMGTDPSTKHRFEARLMQSGYYTGDLTRGIRRSGMQMAKLMSFADARKALVPLSLETPSSSRDIPIRVNITQARRRPGEASGRVSKVLDILHEMEIDERKIDVSELEDFSEEELKAMSDFISPGTIDGEDAYTVAARLISGTQDPIENIRWISREQADEFGLVDPAAASTVKNVWALEAAGKAFDAMNGWMRLQVLFLNPAYYPMNFIGNGVMNLMQQGVFYLPNTRMAAYLSRELGEEFGTMVDEVMGSGVAQTLGFREAGPDAVVRHFFNTYATKIVDVIPRRAAFIHEARRMGFDEPWLLKGLLEEADAGNEQALKVLDVVTRRAKDAIVDYDRLNPFEKNVMSRLVFFYPWIKGATRWTVQYPLNHPVQASAFASLLAAQQYYADKEMGDRPWYLDLDIPLPFEGPNGSQYTINPRQAFTFTTPWDLARTGIEFTPGLKDVVPGGGQPLAEMATPVLGASLKALSGQDTFADQSVPMDLGTLGNDYLSLPPIVSKIWGIVGPTDSDFHGLRGPASDDSNFLYPRPTWNKVLGVVFGSLAPKPVNKDKAAWLAQGQRGITPKNKWAGWQKEFKEAFGHEPPYELKRAIDSKIEWETTRDRGDTNDDDGTISMSRLQKKISLAVKYHPEVKQYREQMLAAARQGTNQRREVDAALENMLGWAALRSASGDINEYQRSQP